MRFGATKCSVSWFAFAKQTLPASSGSIRTHPTNPPRPALRPAPPRPTLAVGLTRVTCGGGEAEHGGPRGFGASEQDRPGKGKDAERHCCRAWECGWKVSEGKEQREERVMISQHFYEENDSMIGAQWVPLTLARVSDFDPCPCNWSQLENPLGMGLRSQKPTQVPCSLELPQERCLFGRLLF